MRTVFNDDVSVSCAQFYVESDHHVGRLAECFAGQRNGLCGAALPGALFLITGMHTGWVKLGISVHDQAPPLDADWEEVVEVSFRPVGSAVAFGREQDWFYPVGLAETDYRARYCARGMDEAQYVARARDEAEVDSYLLQFWPCPPRPERLVKRTSSAAAYWHEFIRKQPRGATCE